MSYLGGDCRVVEISHEELGGIRIYPKAQEDYQVNSGDFMIDDQDDMVGGDGRPIFSVSRMRASITTPPLARDQAGIDAYLYLKDLQGSPFDAEITIQSHTGEAFGMTGRPVGEIILNPRIAQIEAVKFAGFNFRRI